MALRTEEVFLIDEIQPTNPITYKIKDLNDEEIKGTFYQEELQKKDQTIYRIEKVIRKTKNKALVKWKGYPDEFNCWVSLTLFRLGGGGGFSNPPPAKS